MKLELRMAIFNDHHCEESLSHTYVIFHLFQPSNTNDENFVEKLKNIMRKKEEMKKKKFVSKKRKTNEKNQFL
jgi:hypothetical protein